MPKNSTYEIDLKIKNLEKANKEATDLLDKVRQITKAQDDANKPIEDMLDNFKNIGAPTSGLVSKMEDLKTSLQGMRGFITGLGGAWTKMITAARAFLVTMAPYALIIGGIIAAVLVLRRMWQLNVGGMQSHFFKVWGSIKDAIGKFMVVFDKVLIQFGPILEVIFVIVESIFEVFTEIFSTVVDMISAFGEFIGMGGQSVIDMKALKEVIKWIVYVALAAFIAAFWEIIVAGALIVGAVMLIWNILKFVWNLSVAIGELFADMFTAPGKALENFRKKLMDILPKWLIKLLGGGDSADVNVKTTTVNESSMKTGAKATGGSNMFSNDNRSTSVTVNTSRPIDAQNGQAFGNVLANQLSYN